MFTRVTLPAMVVLVSTGPSLSPATTAIRYVPSGRARPLLSRPSQTNECFPASVWPSAEKTRAPLVS